MEQVKYLETILKCYSSMDIDRLQFYLKDDYSYQDTTKEVFIKEIGKIFKEHKNTGDTELVIYEGKCAGHGCENCDKGGFRFIGNHSRNYLDLIFLMDGDDIKDIFECSGFKTTEYHEELQNSDSIDINIDDLITFSKTPEYWAKVHSAKAAYEEIMTARPRILTYDEMCYWLDRNAFTVKNIANSDFINSRMRWGIFTNLYEKLSDFREYLSMYENAFNRANNSYQLVGDEKDLITWMLEYEIMFSKTPYYFRFGILKDGGGYKSEHIDSIIFTGNQFIEGFSFINHYHKHHLVLLNKYGIYTQDEIPEVIGHTEYDFHTNPVYSIKFHLEKRVEAVGLGILIPFYLNGYAQEQNPKESDLREGNAK